MRTRQRGSALLVAVITVLVITVISVGILRFAGRESVGASASAHEQALISCAEAARIQLLGRLHPSTFYNFGSLAALNVALTPTTSAVGGHYDSSGTNVVLDQVTLLQPQASGPGAAARDITGSSSAGAGQPKNVKVVAHCQDGAIDGGRQLEVEFGIQLPF